MMKFGKMGRMRDARNTDSTIAKRLVVLLKRNNNRTALPSTIFIAIPAMSTTRCCSIPISSKFSKLHHFARFSISFLSFAVGGSDK
ncbi:hypothetical protein AB6A40_007643 [Gnathostoma spinigerum]|uniref:Uncharacterized protein n=1 Tax=Gnathostoma spinigerum TaxID=75299 RepID=A0ABD6ERY6_9BILA